jgi:hypothetical protein
MPTDIINSRSEFVWNESSIFCSVSVYNWTPGSGSLCFNAVETRQRVAHNFFIMAFTRIRRQFPGASVCVQLLLHGSCKPAKCVLSWNSVTWMCLHRIETCKCTLLWDLTSKVCNRTEGWLVGYLSSVDLTQELWREAIADSFGTSVPTFIWMVRG